jgi:hypothetical protein
MEWRIPMLVRTLIGACALALALSPAAFAASASSAAAKSAKQTKQAERCIELERQFDAEVATHGDVEKIAEARRLRDDGGKLCASGKHASAVRKLESALKDLGVKPIKM